MIGQAVSRRDGVVVAAIYAAIAVGLALSWWRGQVPFPFLGGDAGNIASFAAGWLHPDAWAGDMVLSDSDNFRFYATIHIPLLMGLSAVVGDLGTAFALLLAPVMWVQAMGFRLLGRVVFNHAGGAFVLGLVSFGTVPMVIDYYGTYHDAQPRFLFQAALPFLLAGLITAIDHPRNWPALFGWHGLAHYLHPVSSPSIALATWLTLAVRGPRGRVLAIWLGWLVLAGLAYVILILPFAVLYLHDHKPGGSDLDYAAGIARMSRLFGAYFTDGLLYAQTLFGTWRSGIFVPMWGMVGALIVWRFAPERRHLLWVLLIWLAMVVAGSLGVTLLEQAISNYLQVLPVEIDTIRNLRYVVPILLVLGVWGATLVAERLSRRWAMAVLAASAIVWLGVNKPGVMPVRSSIECLSSGRLLCPPAEWGERLAMLDALRQLPAGTSVLPALHRHEGVDASLAMRYYALQPVTFSYKDGGTSLGYANPGAIDLWQDLAARLEAAHQSSDWDAIAAMADDLKAGAIAADMVPPADLPGWRQVHGSGRYSVFVRSAM